jgi:hypothetical protein
MPKPTVGRSVLVLGGPAVFNGTDVAPAVITRVWSDELVNVTVFPDSSQGVCSCTSVRLCRDEATARGTRDSAPEGSTAAYAYWPTIS